MEKIKNALSIDLEEWYQGILQIDSKDWPRHENRINIGLEKILDILSRRNIKATFFVLGYLAEKNPKAVKAIADAGHEIASHGWGHRPVYELSMQQFREDVARSKRVLESITNTKVIGYRAPLFSVTKKSLWALDILKDLGFEYDSSVFPTKNFCYGIPDAPLTKYNAGAKGIIEFPMSVIKVFGFSLPVCGGFYMRALPYFMTKHGIRHFNKHKGPAVFYMHPWELDADKPKIALSLVWKIIHEYNIGTMENKFKKLTNDFEFTSIKEVLFGTQG